MNPDPPASEWVIFVSAPDVHQPDLRKAAMHLADGLRIPHYVVSELSAIEAVGLIGRTGFVVVTDTLPTLDNPPTRRILLRCGLINHDPDRQWAVAHFNVKGVDQGELQLGTGDEPLGQRLFNMVATVMNLERKQK